APQFQALLSGLPPSTPLTVRAYAQNAQGFGGGSDTMQQLGRGASTLLAKIMDVPGVPAIASIWPVSFSQIGLSFTPPTASGGTIKTYRLEATPDATFGTPEVIAIDVTSAIPGDVVGTFQLTYGGKTTQYLTIDTTAVAMKTAINALPNLRPVVVARATYVLLGVAGSQVTAFATTPPTLTTTALAAAHVSLLAVGTTIRTSNGVSFTVAAVPSVGATTISVTPAAPAQPAFGGVALSLLVVDTTGILPGAYGYRWLVTFTDEPFGIDVTSPETFSFYPAPTLASVAGAGALVSSYAISTVAVFAAPHHYTKLELSAEPWCNTYVMGHSSPMQVLRFFASTTITAGGYTLSLDGIATTSCIPWNAPASGTPNSVKTLLLTIPTITAVSVEQINDFKVLLLPGSATMAVTAFDGTTTLTLVSTGGPGLTQTQADALPVGTLIRVSKSPWDVTQDTCDFTVTTAGALNAVTLAVTLVNVQTTSATCTAFTGDQRTLSIFDMPSYRIVFVGDYSMGSWPTLRVTNFGTGVCAAFPFAPAAFPVKSRVKTFKYEGACAAGNPEVQTLIADADTTLGGTFTVSYGGQVSSPLAAIVPSTTTITGVSAVQHNTNGRAWQITFAPQASDSIDLFQVNDAFLTGVNAEIHRYPAVEIVSTSMLDSLQGTFTIALGGETTGPLGVAATFNKVLQSLQALNSVYTAMPVANVASDPNQIGFTQLQLTVTATQGSAVLTTIVYKSYAIDPSLYVVVGDAVTIGAETHTIVAVSGADITLDAVLVGAGGPAVTASVGMLLVSTKAAPGVVSTPTTTAAISVVTATTGSATVVFASGHGLQPNDIVTLGGSASYTVQSFLVDGVTATVAP
ncbi:hypothetical protein As57867_019250, partial [Aphanomyces stellatus]